MICKEDVVSWFKDLESYKRIDTMCTLLNMCLPFELRFLGTCLEELGRRDAQELRAVELHVNNPQEFSSDIASCQYGDPTDIKIRRKIAMFLALVRACNRTCVNELFKTLDGWGERDFVKFNDGDPLQELLLVYTMATNHPVFSFEQRLRCGEIFTKITASREKNNNSSSSISSAQLPNPMQQPPCVPSPPSIPHPPPSLTPQHIQHQPTYPQFSQPYTSMNATGTAAVPSPQQYTQNYHSSHQQATAIAMQQHGLPQTMMPQMPNTTEVHFVPNMTMPPPHHWQQSAVNSLYAGPFDTSYPPPGSPPAQSQSDSPAHSRTASPIRNLQHRNSQTRTTVRSSRRSSTEIPPSAMVGQDASTSTINKNSDEMALYEDVNVSVDLQRNNYNPNNRHNTIPRQSAKQQNYMNHTQNFGPQISIIPNNLHYQFQNFHLMENTVAGGPQSVPFIHRSKSGSDSGSSTGSTDDRTPPNTPSLTAAGVAVGVGGTHATTQTSRLIRNNNLAKTNGRTDNNMVNAVIYSQYAVNNDILLPGPTPQSQPSGNNNSNNMLGDAQALTQSQQQQQQQQVQPPTYNNTNFTPYIINRTLHPNSIPLPSTNYRQQYIQPNGEILFNYYPAYVAAPQQQQQQLQQSQTSTIRSSPSLQLQQQQPLSSNQTPIPLSHQSISSTPIMAITASSYPVKPLVKSCFNCGAQTHTGRECQEASMEDITRHTNYKLDYSVNNNNNTIYQSPITSQQRISASPPPGPILHLDSALLMNNVDQKTSSSLSTQFSSSASSTVVTTSSNQSYSNLTDTIDSNSPQLLGTIPSAETTIASTHIVPATITTLASTHPTSLSSTSSSSSTSSNSNVRQTINVLDKTSDSNKISGNSSNNNMNKNKK